MKKRIPSFVIIALFAITIYSCSASYRNATSNITKVELGMSKDQVVTIMGKNYIPYSSSNENSVYREVIAYSSIHLASGRMYLFYFLNGKLEKWQQEWVGAPYPSPQKDDKSSD